MTEFKRENRYMVLKNKDIEFYLTEYQQALLEGLVNDVRQFKPRQFVIVESDWPEYEIVWALIEARVTGQRVSSSMKVLHDHVTDLQKRIVSLEGFIKTIENGGLPDPEHFQQIIESKGG